MIGGLTRFGTTFGAWCFGLRPWTAFIGLLQRNWADHVYP